MSDVSKENEPTLLYNDSPNGVKVLSSLTNALETCDSFDFSVAFITMGGISSLYQAFRDLNEREVRGRILTTDYMMFNDPDALSWLLNKTNHEVRICEENFHTKGYIFHKDDSVISFVGSSNLTDKALCVNLEWNLKVMSKSGDSYTAKLQSEFERMWENAQPLTPEWIENYKVHYDAAKRPQSDEIYVESREVKPNQMQIEAMSSLKNLRDEGKTRALLISATGTGKTYLSAFDVKEYAPKRFLFLVHNENILKDAMKSYKKVLGDRFVYGFLTGNHKDRNATALFSTIQTMQKEKESFPRDYFDYIVCDEAHHSTAKTYREIIAYFKPGFLLGMTATPERSDQSDVFEMFDYTVAYEIRLNKALDMGILCPFHYYGVSEIRVNGKLIDDNTDFKDLTSEERVKNIIEKAEYYRPYGRKVHGLIFCSRIDECEELSRLMNMHGYRTVAMTGSDSIDERKEAIRRLQSDSDDALDYIFTRDVFNEGVDIPEVNQILMLRPTQSAIIFVQQLGRGLRKTDDPEKSLIVLDFIGNYENNFMIPVALSGDRSHDKDILRRFMISRNLPGCSTVGFEKIAEERILSNINKTNMSKLAMLKSEYLSMRARLGRSPTLCDLLQGGSLDPPVVVDYAGNLNAFRIKAKDKSAVQLTAAQNDMLSFVSGFVEGKRPHELRIIEALIDNEAVSKDRFDDYDADSIDSALRVLDGSFQTEATRKSHPYWSILTVNGSEICRNELFDNAMCNPEFRALTVDAVRCGLEINKERYFNPDNLGFVLGQKYSRADVCRILNWDADVSSTMYGYMIRNNQCPIFVTYNKSDDISDTTKYVEGFQSESVFDWMTRSNRTLKSNEVVQILNSEKSGLQIPFFVKKSDSEGTGFYYLGQVKPIADEAKETTIDQNSVVGIPLLLERPVSDELYRYLIASVQETVGVCYTSFPPKVP